MNIYESNNKNVIRWLAVLVLGIFLVSMMPTPFANETETPLYTETPTVPANYDAFEFFQSFGEEVENSKSKTAWERLDAPLQTFVETGVPTPEMVVLNGQPRVMIIALGTFDLATLPESLTVGRVATLGFMTVFEASVADPAGLLEAAGIEGILSLGADVYLSGDAASRVPVLEETTSFEDFKGQVTESVKTIYDERNYEPDRPIVRELAGLNDASVSGYLGDGVTIGILDQGVDWGVPNLAPAQNLDTAGYPTSYDDGGEGLLYAPIAATESLSGLVPTGDDWMYSPLQRGYDGGTDQAFDYWIYWAALDVPINTGPGGSWQYIDIPTGISQSGIWKLGLTRIGSAGANYRWAVAFFCDPHTAGVYDRLYIDWDASFAISMAYSGLLGDWEWTRSQINWGVSDEHTDGMYWDMMETPQAALGDDNLLGGTGLDADNPAVWAMTYDYWNGSYLGIDSWGAHANTTFEAQHTTSAAANYTSFIMEYCWLDNPNYPITHEVNRFNVTMHTEYNGTVGGLTNASWMANGLYAIGDTVNYRYYAVNASSDTVAFGGSGWKTAVIASAYTVDAAFQDGYPDISFGSLCHTYDTGGLIDAFDYVAFMTGDADETYAATMYGNLYHGTRVAMDAVARGNADDASIPEWDVFQNGTGTTWDLRGSAPAATLMSSKTFSSASWFWAWMWIAGIDVASGGTAHDGPIMSGMGSYVYHNTWAQDYSPQFGPAEFNMLDVTGMGDWIPGYLWNDGMNPYHASNFNPRDLMSNSWGWSAWYGPDRYYLDLIVDGITIPGTMHANWPGMLHVFSCGNSGIGYGTITGPISDLSLQVGAMTTGHTNDDFYGPGQRHEEIAPFQSRGPGTYGNPAPSIMSWGAWHTTVTTIDEVWNGYEAVSTFGGTSAAAPTAAGILAVMIEAWRDLGAPAADLTPLQLKNIAMSTARDLGMDPFSQGAGAIDVVAAVDLIDFIKTGAGTTEYMMTSASTHETMAWFVEDDMRAWYSEIMGIYNNYDASAGFESTIFTGPMMAGDSYLTNITQWDDFGSALANDPSAYTHELDPTYSRKAMLSNNVTWDAALNDSLTGVLNATTGVRTAWNLTEALFSEGLATWVGSDDGMVAFQIAAEEPYSGAGAGWYLHAWDDIGNGTHVGAAYADGKLQYRNSTYTDPGADDWWNSYVSYYPGEAQRISFAYPSSPSTIWVRASTLANLGGYSLALVPQDAWAANMNFTIWAEFYTIQTWDWVTVETTQTVADGSYNVTIDVPAAAEPGFYEGFLQYNAGDAIVPIDVMVGATATERNATETAGGPAPIVTDEYLPGQIYDGGEYRQGDPAELGDTGTFWIYVDQWNATALIVTQNWTKAGMDMYTIVTDSYAGVLAEKSSSATATSMVTVVPISGMGWYIVRSEVYGIDGSASRAGVDMAVNWVYAAPVITPMLDGLAYPSDGDSVGLVSDYGYSNTTLTWELSTATAANYPTLSIVESTLGSGIPPFEQTLDWDMPGSVPQIFYPRDYPGTTSDTWFFYAGTQVRVELHWEVGAGSDMMDAVFRNADTGADAAPGTMGTAGGSPEVADVIIPATGNYWLQIDNFAAADNHGHVYIYGLIPADEPSSSTTGTVSFNTAGMNEVPSWSLAGTAVDSWGYTYAATSTVTVRNIAPPEVEITSAIPDTVSGTLSLTISVVDLQNTNRQSADDQPVWLHIYYTADEAEQFLIPIVTYINATDASASDSVDITFSWDTTRAFNAYVARLWVVADDFIGTSSWASEAFQIINTGGSAAGMAASSSSNSNLFAVGLLLVAVLGIGAIPMLRKFLRIRRR